MMVVYEHQRLRKLQMNLIYHKVTHGQMHPIRQILVPFFHDFFYLGFSFLSFNNLYSHDDHFHTYDMS
jgi:hypothetical protein